MPWKVKPEHKGSVYRNAVYSYWRREHDEPLGDESWRNLYAVEARLKETGQVIDYNPRRKTGFHLVPARTGVDLGLVREPDGKPRPPKRGPYAALEG